MPKSLISYVVDQPLLRVIRGLLLCSRPIHLRELAELCNLSVAGVSDIIRRLNDLGILREVQRGNKRCFSLRGDKEEFSCLRNLFVVDERNSIRNRAKRLGRNAAKTLANMDEMYSFYKQVKHR